MTSAVAPTPPPAPSATAAQNSAPARLSFVARRPALVALLISAGFFAAVAPTLRLLGFSGGSENLVVETVLEMRRGGPWLIPTLNGHARLTKPPLTAWLTAAATRPDTVARLTTRDRPARDAAFRDLAWQVRWPSLLASCLMLLATYALARNTNLPPGVALTAAAACGGTLMFLRFGRAATTDVHLALWVTVTNALLALALFHRRYWSGFLGAGATLGLAFMSKGPVAFVQTLVPFALFLSWRWLVNWLAPSPLYSGERAGVSGQLWLPIIAGLLVMLAVGLPWYAWVLHNHPTILSGWWTEVSREGATQLPPDPWYMYGAFFLWTVPWLAWFVAGLWLGGLHLFRPSAARPTSPGGATTFDDAAARDGTVLSFLLFLAPVVVMSLFRDKPERYLLPVLPPAAVLAARAAVAWWQSNRRDPGGRVVEAAHWVTLLVIALGLPIAGLLMPRFGMGAPWFSPLTAAVWAVVGAGVVVTGFALRGRNAGAWAIAATTVLMLLLQYPVMRAYAEMDRPDLKPLADAVWDRYPDAAVYEYDPTGRPRVRNDLPIYLGRLTSKVLDPLTLQRGDRPQVVVIFERHAPSAPALPPPWRQLAAGGNRKDPWRAYVLPATPRE